MIDMHQMSRGSILGDSMNPQLLNSLRDSDRAHHLHHRPILTSAGNLTARSSWRWTGPMTDTAARTHEDVLTELKGWLEENWDPDLTVGEWWERLGTSGWAVPTWPDERFGKGLSREERSEGHYLRISRYSTLGWALGLIAVAYASREVPFVLNAAFALTGLTSGALLGGLLAALFTKKGSAAPVIVGMLTSLAAMIVIQLKTEIAWPWYTLIGATVTLLVTWLARALLSPGEPG